MAFRHVHASKGSYFLGWLLLSILVFVLPKDWTKSLNYLFHELLSPVLQIGHKISIENLRMAEPGEDIVQKEQYNQLWKNYKNLEAKMAEVERENLLLSRIRKQFDLSGSALLIAKVNTLMLAARHEAVINMGTLYSIRPGQIVLSKEKNSIVGTVKDASENIARVQLLTDSAHIIEVIIRRDGTNIEIPAQMFGDGKNGCRIGFIPRDTDVQKGDTVYAVPQKGMFEIPMVVGEVSEVTAGEQDASVWDIRVAPIEALSSLTEVVVVIPIQDKK